MFLCFEKASNTLSITVTEIIIVYNQWTKCKVLRNTLFTYEYESHILKLGPEITIRNRSLKSLLTSGIYHPSHLRLKEQKNIQQLLNS